MSIINDMFWQKNWKILSIIILLLCFIVYPSKQVLFEQTDINEYGEKYSQSQYVMGDAAIEKIGDSDLYVYAGYAYAKGEDPTTINFEHPPLAKYFYGWSYFLTGNSYLINVLLYGVILYLLFLLSKRIIKHKFFSYLVVLTFSTLPLFTYYIDKVILDVPMLLSILLFFLTLFWQTKKQNLRYISLGIILGAMMSIKYPFPFMIISFGILGIYSLIEKNISKLFISLVTAVIVYLFSYSAYFIHGHTLIDFIQFEKYRFSWWTGDRIAPKFLIFQNIMLGRHDAWWEPGTYIKTEEWTLSVPLIFIGSLLSIPVIKKNKEILTIYLFSMITLLGFGIGAGSALRYLLIVVPFWIISIFSMVEYFKRRYISTNSSS